MEQTRTIEITQSQYKHLKEVLAMDKPSRTRLTKEEKGYILLLLSHECDAMAGYSDDDKDDHFFDRQRNIDSIRKKLK
jgi:hypothetical protein